MENPTIPVMSIEDGVYDFDLKQLVMKMQYDQPHQKEVLTVISKLLRSDLRIDDTEGFNTYFSSSEVQILKNYSLGEMNNQEVLAKWYDTLIALDKRNIKSYIGLAQSAYSQVYLGTKKNDYLIRSIALVKYAKGIFQGQLETLFEWFKSSFLECDSAYYQQLVLIELIAVYGQKRCREVFGDFLENRIAHFLLIEDFRSGRFCIRSLHLVGALDGNQCNIRMAESYEAEGDQAVSEMQPNTYYPNIASDFLKGFRLIASACDCNELRDRLEQKVAKYQVETFRTLQAGGVRMIPKIDLDDIHRNVLKMNLSSSSLAYHTLLDLPVVPKSAVEQMADSYKENSGGLDLFFSEQVKISHKGAQVAAQDIAESYAGYARSYIREKVMAYIYFIKLNLDGYLEMNRAMVFKLLQDAKSPFVPEDRYHDYSLGLAAGFANDYITAAHLLLPQLENSLRHLAVSNGIIVTTYEKRFQLENLLGGLIKKVKPLANEDIMDELDSFLVDNNNVNFRNELLHGLMETALAQKYGQYVWWLCLKMIVQTKIIFPAAKN